MGNHTLGSALAVVDELWPAAGAEEWDSPGLVVGAEDQRISSIHLVVDATPESVAEAIAAGADLIIAHHPLLLRGVTSVAESTYKGRVVTQLITAGVSLYSAHTNADVVPTGTSARLAELIGLTDHAAIVPSATPGHGMGRVGTVPEPISLYRLAVTLGEVLPQTAVGPVVAGDPEAMISRIAVCAGAGDSLLGEPAVLNSDVYITSDLRHHPASEFRERGAEGSGPALINISHFAAEWLWLEVAAQELRDALGIDVVVSDLNTDPWSFQVHRMDAE
jgi:dinuclear metal center YbgI/SA1388 family protein